MPANENWYALRTFYSQELKVGAYLDTYKLSWFIPMRGKTKGGTLSKVMGEKKRPKPFVHNLIFIKQPEDISVLKNALKECPYTTFMYCNPGSMEWSVISGKDILELRIICDQSFSEPIFITTKEAELKVGREVRVVHGPLSGTHGRLIRKNKKYYVLKTIFSDMSMMVAVSRWCCEAVNTD